MKNDYYVYLHHLEDGTVFYVGKGRLNRAYSKQCRPKSWEEIVKTTNYTASFYKENLSEKEALDLELELLNSLPNLVNVSRKNHITKLDSCNIREYVEYSETSPSGLVWKIDRYFGRFKSTSLHTKKGTPVGTINKSRGDSITGWRCSINKTTYYVHRIIYALYVGDIPDGMIINHIDNNPLNNRLDNLELCTIAENSRKTKVHTSSLVRNTSSGITGVSYDACVPKYTRYQAYYKDPFTEKLITKTFSVNKYGKEEAFRLACEWRIEQIAELNKQGAGYTERHGT